MEAFYATNRRTIRIYAKAIPAQHCKDSLNRNSANPHLIDGRLVPHLLFGLGVLRPRLSPPIPPDRLAGMAEAVSATLYLTSNNAP